MTLKEALTYSKEKLEGHIVDWHTTSFVFLEDILGLNFTELYTTPDRILSEGEIQKLKSYISRRLNNEPTSQIIGSVQFCGLNIIVSREVLTPRPETELLVQKALQEIRADNLKILDLGTGSGAIICALADKTKNARLYASDISNKALKVAKQNINSLGFEKRIVVKKGDLFEPWSGEHFDVVLANLPYIPETRKNNLDKSVVDYEPEIALFSGTDGLDAYRRFLAALPVYLGNNGVVFCEIDETQGKSFKELVESILPEYWVEIVFDLYGFARIAIIREK